MSIPVIDTTTSIFRLRVHQNFNWQPFATNTPTSWACPILPPGLAINTTTGLISGIPTTAGRWDCSLTAINGSGTSSALLLYMGVKASSVVPNGALGVQMDLGTGILSNPLYPATKAADPDKLSIPVIMEATLGDTKLLSITCLNAGVPQDLSLDELVFRATDLAGNPSLLTSDNTFTQLGSFESTVYQKAITFDATLLAPALSSADAIDDAVIYTDLVCELAFANPTGVIRTVPFLCRVYEPLA